MLQAIAPAHDPHHLRTVSRSAAALVAARADGKKHLLLAASV